MSARYSVLLIISGSIAAYKALELIRRLQERGVSVQCILTKGGAEFITPLSVASLSGKPVYTELFSLKDETEMGHIRLTREADLVIVAPASADLLARMVSGAADDLATATLLANNKKLLIAPAMNTQMWKHAATQRNLEQLRSDGARIITPGEGVLACGEVGEGRMAEPDAIADAVLHELRQGPLSGYRALVTSGPTHEPIDPVRFIGNRSSGKQGHAIAEMLARKGADVTLVTGPVALEDPKGVHTLHVTTAEEMLAACINLLPVDIAVCAAAVADWKAAAPSAQKLKKRANATPPAIALLENPDILASLASHAKRPALVIGFAAETSHMLQAAQEKLVKKQCDWLLANDVSGNKVFDAEENQVTLITADHREPWPLMPKTAVASELVQHIIHYFNARSAT